MDAFPRFAADGIKNYQFGRPEVGSNGMSISANVKDKDAAVKFMDDLLGEEGRNYLSLGIQGKTYKLENGKPRYMEEFGSSPYVPLRRDWGAWFITVSLNNAVSRDAWERRLDDKFKVINANYEKLGVDEIVNIYNTAYKRTYNVR